MVIVQTQPPWLALSPGTVGRLSSSKCQNAPMATVNSIPRSFLYKWFTKPNFTSCSCIIFLTGKTCQGPAPADPGYSKRGRRRQPI